MNVRSIVVKIVTVILSAVSPEILKFAVEAMVDAIEAKVKNSTNKVDDQIVLPLCKKIREALSLDDQE